MIKAVIFDFNGTMYLDHDLNSITWQETFNSVKNREVNETWESLHTKNINLINDYHASKSIYEYFGYKPTLEMINELSEKKEKKYRDLARKLNRNRLMEGLDEVLNYLAINKIPYCIASMAPKSNFDFYLDYLKLNKWFSYKNIIYDDGRFNTKNEQIIAASKLMDVEPKDCLLIEDSLKNIKLAKEAFGMNNIIFMNTRGASPISKEIGIELKSYKDFDYSILSN